MSRRDTYWFIAGAASGLTAGALSVYFLMGAPNPGKAAAGTDSHAETNTPERSHDSLNDLPVGLLAPGSTSAAATSSNAGSLESVTDTLAQRLATQGGTDDEWNLLAQSFEYMGRAEDARAAREHKAPKVAAAQGSRISGTVQIAPSLAPQATPGTTLFIYAMDTTDDGPPLAVLRLKVERWPVSFVLDDADAMIPGRNLSASRSIHLEARISPTGEALPHEGDLVGKLVDIDPHTSQPVNISIDHKIT